MSIDQKKVLVLEIEVPGWYADDLEERAELVARDLEGVEPPLYFLLTEEMLEADQVEVRHGLPIRWMVRPGDQGDAK